MEKLTLYRAGRGALAPRQDPKAVTPKKYVELAVHFSVSELLRKTTSAHDITTVGTLTVAILDEEAQLFSKRQARISPRLLP
jgi:hypothetical protein